MHLGVSHSDVIKMSRVQSVSKARWRKDGAVGFRPWSSTSKNIFRDGLDLPPTASSLIITESVFKVEVISTSFPPIDNCGRAVAIIKENEDR